MSTDKNEQAATLDAQIKWTRTALIHQARAAADQLLRLADKLEKFPDASINSIGELQHTGTAVDAYCGQLSALQSLKREWLKV